MCIAVLAIGHFPEFSVVIAHNRDEFFARPARAAAFWDDNDRIWGGRDLEAGGSWLGVSRTGRLALVTNLRDLRLAARAEQGQPDRTRGELVREFLAGTQAPIEFLRQVNATAYKPFNLIVGTLGATPHLIAYNAIEGQPRPLGPGIHAISNGYLDANWPKIQRIKQGIAADSEALFQLLVDRQPADQDALPDTGLPRERELQLSSIFIDLQTYGTRASTVIRATATMVEAEERTHAPGRQDIQRAKTRFPLAVPTATAE